MQAVVEKKAMVPPLVVWHWGHSAYSAEIVISAEESLCVGPSAVFGYVIGMRPDFVSLILWL